MLSAFVVRRGSIGGSSGRLALSVFVVCVLTCRDGGTVCSAGNGLQVRRHVGAAFGDGVAGIDPVGVDIDRSCEICALRIQHT